MLPEKELVLIVLPCAVWRPDIYYCLRFLLGQHAWGPEACERVQTGELRY